MSTNVKHLSLGSITKAVGLEKSSLKTAAALGAGSVAAITLSDLAQSRLLVRNGQPMVPMAWAPAFGAAFGLVVGSLAKKRGYPNIGAGMIAGGIGVGISALIAKYTSPAAAASQTASAAAEDAGASTQQTSGFGFGRAFAPSMAAMSGLGRAQTAYSDSRLFGVGTPDMSGANMFGGTTVAIENAGGPMSGATVALEDSNAFAGSLM